AVNLHRIRVDDGTVERSGQIERQRRLAAGGRACDKQRLDRLLPFLVRPLAHKPPSMSLVATLIANPAEPCLDDAALTRARNAVAGATDIDQLAPRIAADMPLPAAITQEAALNALRAALDGLPIDIVVQPAQGRRKRLFLA